MTTLVPSFSNESSSFLQVRRTTTKAWMTLNFCQIQRTTTELAAPAKNQCLGLRIKGSLVRDLAGSPFYVALSKSYLPPA